jgi:hypothetical protein
MDRQVTELDRRRAMVADQPELAVGQPSVGGCRRTDPNRPVGDGRIEELADLATKAACIVEPPLVPNDEDIGAVD